MTITKTNNYLLFTTQATNFSDALKSFNENALKHPSENIVLLIKDNLNIKTTDFLSFLDFATQKKENGTSFVVVITSLDIDNLPEEINVVPSLQEAEDILEMENIERELGF